MSELMAYLMATALKLSGLPPIDYTPPVLLVSPVEMTAIVCPENPLECRSVVSYFSMRHKLILLRSDQDPESNIGSSFILHEIIHAMQYEQQGGMMYATCWLTIKTEQEAYRIQNQYLKDRGELYRAGIGIEWETCE